MRDGGKAIFYVLSVWYPTYRKEKCCEEVVLAGFGVLLCGRAGARRYYSIQLDRGCVKRSKTRPYISHQWGGGVGWTTQVYGNVGNTTFVLRQYVMVMDPDKRKFVTDWKHQIRMMEREGWQGLSWR